MPAATPVRPAQRRRRFAVGAATMLCALFAAHPAARAQEPIPGFDAAPNMTVVPRSAPEPAAQDGEPRLVRLSAQLTADGQRIDQGLIWRVFQDQGEGAERSKLLSTHRDAAPAVKLQPGIYLINAAFGRAHLTRKIIVEPGAEPLTEPFVLNAGGLRLTALVGGQPASAKVVSYSIYSDRDQSDTRKLIMAGVKPAIVIRLNAGIYHIVSTYGDCNATVLSDVTVEAGKLTETTVTHAAAKATFKLVSRAGGEALPDTQWTIQDPLGETVKESVGALPTHILAPGTYTVLATSEGKAFRRDFTLTDGETAQVEVIIK